MSRRTRSPPQSKHSAHASTVPPLSEARPWDWRAKRWLWVLVLFLLLTSSAALTRPFPSAWLVHAGYFLYVVSNAIHDELILRLMSLAAAVLFLLSSVRAATWGDVDAFGVAAQLVLLALSTRRTVALALAHTPFRFTEREVRTITDGCALKYDGVQSRILTKRF